MQFRPSITQTLILVTLAAVFFRLGMWQLERKAEKELLLEHFETAPSMGLAEALADGEPFTRVSARGRYDPERHLLLDNKVWQGRAGVHVLTPFRTDQGPSVLVNRGWLPLPADRSRLPDVPTPDNDVELTGRLAPPPAVGRQLGAPDELVADSWPQLTTYFDLPAVAGALGETLPPWVVLLDAGNPNGFGDRQWSPVAMTPETHGGYAVQWLALLLATIVAWVIVGLRRGEQMGEGPQVTGNGKRAGGERE
jgi:surfeit locus 1 family protein